MDNFTLSSFYFQKMWQDLAGLRNLPSQGLWALGAHLFRTLGKVLLNAGLALYFSGVHLFWGSRSDGEPRDLSPLVAPDLAQALSLNGSVLMSEPGHALSFTEVLMPPIDSSEQKSSHETSMCQSSPPLKQDGPDPTLTLIALELGMGQSEADLISIQKILYTYQSNPNLRIDSIPALHMSCEARSPTVASVILKAGPSVETINYQKPLGHPLNPGSTALMLACQHGPAEVVELLLAQGAKIELLNGEGQGAVDFLLEDDSTVFPWSPSFRGESAAPPETQIGAPLLQRHEKYRLLLEARAKAVCEGDSVERVMEKLTIEAYAEWGAQAPTVLSEDSSFWREAYQRLHNKTPAGSACDGVKAEPLLLSMNDESDAEEAKASTPPGVPVCSSLEGAPLTYKLCALGYVATAKLTLLRGISARDLRWYSDEEHMSIMHYGALYADPMLVHLALLHGASDPTPRGQRTVRQLLESRHDHASAPFISRLHVHEPEQIRNVAELLERYGYSKVSGARSRAGSRL